MLGVIVLGGLFAEWATAGMVSVEVKTSSGAPAPDTVVIFDPLDPAPPAGDATAIIDQLNKTFVPRVSVIRTGTLVSLPNSDSIRHEVYSHSPPHPFKVKLYASDHREEIRFDKPGLLVLGCNIHDSMVAFLLVSDSPFFTKIPATGIARLNLPVGRYRVRVWNEKLRAPAAASELTVTGATTTLPLTVDLDPTRTTVPDIPD
jgi:plastocyanin